jgi:subtilisin-like proprotein convertase family protein
MKTMRYLIAVIACLFTLGLSLFAQAPCSNPQACNYASNFVDFGAGLPVPDDQSQCFSGQLTFTSFNAGAIVNDANVDIMNIFMNIEHSFMGDLTITFICPIGLTMIVHQQGGVGTFLGVPVDNGALPDNPGEGWDYWWDPGATNGTWADNAGVTLPSGVYESVQPFTNLDGCPLNGTWEVEVCDLWASDNGFIFSWGIEFAESFYNNSNCLFIGDPCDDEDPDTVGDVFQEDCECAGTPNTIVNELESLSVLIYPNPTSSYITVDLGDLNGVNTNIKLYDSSSKLVFEKQSSSTLMIDVSTYAEGLYTLELSTSDNVTTNIVVIE